MDDFLKVIVTTVLIPVILVAFKTLLGVEVKYWITFLHYRFNRPYDIDNNPDTHDWLMIYNEGDGQWECCSLTFHFSFYKNKSGAFLYRYNRDWKLGFIERVNFIEWASVRKAKLNVKNLPDGLEEKIQQMKNDETPLLRNIKFPKYDQ